MKTIQLRKETKVRLDIFAKHKSINKAMRELLESAETVDTVPKPKTEYANIHIDDDLWIKLKNCKKHDGESHSDVIERLLDEFQK